MIRAKAYDIPQPKSVSTHVGKPPVRVLSNFSDLDQIDAHGEKLACELADNGNVFEFARKCLRSDLVILNIGQKELMIACLLRWLLPIFRFRLVSVDLILRPPKTISEKLKAFVKRVLLKRVDCFVLYFKDVQGYQRYYGVGPDRAVYVPFKVNGREKIVARARPDADGDYVLCAGRTLRDIGTFVEAIKITECPAVLLQQQRELLAAHGTTAWSEARSNLKLVVDDTDSIETYFDFIEKARLVVIPRFKRDIAPTGISTYLVAMALNKCVIISEGPGAGDVLTNQAVIVPPEDPERLAEQIKMLWSDDEQRTEVATRGNEYAMSLGGGERLLSDILRVALNR